MANETVVRDVMDNVRRIVQALRSSHRAAGKMNLTGAQLFVIATLADTEAAMSVGELAAQTRTDQSTVSVVVSRLVEKGLVKRSTSTKDSRRAELTLTAKGKAVAKKAPSTVPQQRLATALEKLPPKDAALLARLLQHIVEQMGEADKPAAMMFEERTPRAK